MKKGQLPSIRIDEEMEERVRDAADLDGLSVSGWMRDTLEAAANKRIARRKPKQDRP